MSNIIFYFSGTGNSFAISKAVAEKLGDTELVPISRINDKEIEGYDFVGFVTPVYYLHAPNIVLQHLKNYKPSKGQRIIIIVTYAASRGYALSDLKNQLCGDGISIQEFCVKMPGNYILEYGAFPQFYQKRLLRKSEKKTDSIVDAIIYSKPTKTIQPNLLARLFKHTGIGKEDVFKTLGTQFYADVSCVGCGMCERICPVSNISSVSQKLVWGNNCQQCMACIQWCPQKAIKHPAIKKDRTPYTHPNIHLQQLFGSDLHQLFKKSKH